MLLIKAIEFFKGVKMIVAKIIWDMFMEKMGPELLEELKRKTEPR